MHFNLLRMKFVFTIILFCSSHLVSGQGIKNITFGPGNGLVINKIELQNRNIIVSGEQPLFSFNVNEQHISSKDFQWHSGDLLCCRC